MNLRANPFIGEYTNEELQEWVKALQDECVRMTVSNDLYDRVDANNDRIIKLQVDIIAERKELLRIRDQQIDLLKSVIDRYERIPIDSTTLVAFSHN